MMRFLSLSLVVIIAVLQGGCFVSGVDPAIVELDVQRADEDGEASARLIAEVPKGWDPVQAVAAEVSVTASDLLETEAEQATVPVNSTSTNSLELQMLLPAGEARAFSAVVFDSEYYPTQAFESISATVVDLEPGEQAEPVVLTVNPLGSGTLILNLNTDTDGWTLALQDRETGFILPRIACSKESDSALCTYSDAPVGRELVPILQDQASRSFDLTDFTFLLAEPGAELELNIVKAYLEI